MTVPRPRDQFGALVHSFLARFFENEITSGTDDLKNSFFWLLAFLMVPGLFMPFVRSFDWEMIARFQGTAALQVLSRGDKAFYIGFAMIASALIGAIAWSSLLMDRLDGLILGALPVRPAVVVRAKLAALGVYILLIAVGMHTLSALAFGTLLSNHGTLAFVARMTLPLQFQCIPAVLPLLVADLGISYAQAGLLIGVFWLPGVALALPGGMIGALFGVLLVVVLFLPLRLEGGDDLPVHLARGAVRRERDRRHGGGLALSRSSGAGGLRPGRRRTGRAEQGHAECPEAQEARVRLDHVEAGHDVVREPRHRPADRDRDQRPPRGGASRRTRSSRPLPDAAAHRRPPGAVVPHEEVLQGGRVAHDREHAERREVP